VAGGLFKGVESDEGCGIASVLELETGQTRTAEPRTAAASSTRSRGKNGLL